MQLKKTVAISSALVLAAGIGVAIDAGIASASIPDSSGNINACYNNYLGNVRIIDSPSVSCNADETSISWAQNGANVYTVTQSFVYSDDNLNIGGVGRGISLSCNSSSDTVLAGGLTGYNTTLTDNTGFNEGYLRNSSQDLISVKDSSSAYTWDFIYTGNSSWFLNGTAYVVCLVAS
jgi:hypothetical protein